MADKSLEKREPNDSLDEGHAQSVVARILARRGTILESAEGRGHSWDAGTLEREARVGTQRIQSRRSDHEDISEVEYRQIQLEYVVPVGLRTTQSKEEVDTSLRELTTLVETAGSQALNAVVQKCVKLDPATYLGSGKARELADIACSVEADIVIVDEELAPSQRRSLEDVIDVKVADRTTLILDTFVQHVKPREGKA